MGISAAVIEGHIEYWQKRLKSGAWPYRQHWPSRLFRHEPIENAVKIIKDGRVLSRNQAGQNIPRDIAPHDIIGRRDLAHSSVRLYFRPRTPTQYHIEGIKKPGEYYQGRHAPVLIVFIFDMRKILSRLDVHFSDGNMQSDSADVLNTDAEFQNLSFEHIYHEGSFPSGSATGQTIKNRRCAEVLVPDRLPLNNSLRGILCRTPAERATLLHLLGDSADQWRPRIRTYTEPGIFQREFTHMESVDVSDSAVRFNIHPRRDGQPVSAEMWIFGENGGTALHMGAKDLDPSSRWSVKHKLGQGRYVARFHLENCLAYEAPFVIDDLPF